MEYLLLIVLNGIVFYYLFKELQKIRYKFLNKRHLNYLEEQNFMKLKNDLYVIATLGSSLQLHKELHCLDEETVNAFLSDITKRSKIVEFEINKLEDMFLTSNQKVNQKIG
jgi:hypothetical protein